MFDTEAKRRQPPSKGLRYYVSARELEVRPAEEGEGGGAIFSGSSTSLSRSSGAQAYNVPSKMRAEIPPA